MLKNGSGPTESGRTTCELNITYMAGKYCAWNFLPPVAPRTDLLLKVSQCCHLQNRLATAFNTAEKKTSENDKLCTVSAGYGSKLAMCRSKQISLRSYLRFLNVSEIFPRIVLYISCQKSTSRRQHKNSRKPSSQNK